MTKWGKDLRTYTIRSAVDKLSIVSCVSRFACNLTYGIHGLGHHIYPIEQRNKYALTAELVSLSRQYTHGLTKYLNRRYDSYSWLYLIINVVEMSHYAMPQQPRHYSFKQS